MIPNTRNIIFKSYVVINKLNLLSNLKELDKYTTGIKKMIVVKSNAYGHGLHEIVSILKNSDIDFFGVDSIEEAIGVLSVTKKIPILILGYVPMVMIEDAINSNISITVYSLDVLKHIVSLNNPNKAKIHLKIETGLNRQGIGEKDLPKILKYVKSHQGKFDLEGVSMHFANVEDTLDQSFAVKQMNLFKVALQKIRGHGFDPKLIHASASAGTILMQSAHFTMVRIGIAIYGLWPSREVKIAVKLNGRNLILKPVLEWKSQIVQVKVIELGESVGYGRSWFAPRKSKIGILPIGYFDGYDRGLSNNSRVLVNGEYAPVVGRIAMNMCMVDVTDIVNVKVGDEAVLIGKQKNKSITVEELSDRIGTINYEFVSRINPLIKRVIV